MLNHRKPLLHSLWPHWRMQVIWLCVVCIMVEFKSELQIGVKDSESTRLPFVIITFRPKQSSSNLKALSTKMRSLQDESYIHTSCSMADLAKDVWLYP